MKRLASLLLANLTMLLVFASAALADADNDHGEGWFGETTDLDITIAGFILIAGFPTFILLASLLMWRLDKRKDARKYADKARAQRADARGGW
jgi:uncharacterized membrane-anchored protein